VVHTDINEAMLRVGRDRLLDEGLALPTLTCDAERLPFADGQLRPRQRRLRPAQHDPQGPRAGRDGRVLRPGGRLLVLEFSKVAEPLRKPYDWYSFNVMPLIGRWSPRTPTATATWPSRSACTPTRRR
jgi:demethylmenaquinone methyltransferase/2-methoxy-6-polyprenyl-1,4-benzoquinol methylase